MIFGRVDAVATLLGSPGDTQRLHITVMLEMGRSILTVRNEIVPALKPIADDTDLAWQADQYAQETISNELAIEGWEVIGGGEIPEIADGELARSATYAVRKVAHAE